MKNLQNVWICFAIAFLQLFSVAYCQDPSANPTPASDAPVPTTAIPHVTTEQPQPTTTVVVPTTTPAPPPPSTTTQPVPTSSAVTTPPVATTTPRQTFPPVQATTQAPIVNPTTTTVARPTASNASPTNSEASKENSASSLSSSPSESSIPTPGKDSSSKAGSGSSESSNVGTIAGAVVGGVVGLALIGGCLTWMNRRGGCTKRQKKHTTDFEDFGLTNEEFPHHRSPAMTDAGIGSNIAGTGIGSTVSPTIPRLNEQGNFYNESSDYNHYYQPQLTAGHEYAPPGTVFSPQQQHQQSYYYQDGGYYDDHGGYYYEGNTAPAGHGHPQHTVYAENMGDYYKPDSTDGKPHQRI